MLGRRRFLFAAALCAINTRNGRAQARLPRIGVLSGLPLEKSAAAPALLKALADLGYRNKAEMQLEYRYSHDPAQFPALAKELVSAKCDLMFALVSEATARALRDARSSIPAIFLAFDYDPVEKGIVESLRRPGGSMTGVYLPNDALIAKRVEIVQEVLPRASRLLVLSDMHTKDQLAALRKAAGLEAGRRDNAVLLAGVHRGTREAGCTLY